MKEIELKAYIDDLEKTEGFVKKCGLFFGKLIKSDNYWKNFDYLKTLRLRKLNSKIFLTLKNKQIENKVEINDEIELEISNKEKFEQILIALNFNLVLKKKKIVRAYKFNLALFLENVKRGMFNHVSQKNVEEFSTLFNSAKSPEILIELCFIEGLSWFIEIEIVLTNYSKEIINLSKQLLHFVLKICNIESSKIEERFYSELLED